MAIRKIANQFAMCINFSHVSGAAVFYILLFSIEVSAICIVAVADLVTRTIGTGKQFCTVDWCIANTTVTDLLYRCITNKVISYHQSFLGVSKY